MGPTDPVPPTNAPIAYDTPAGQARQQIAVTHPDWLPEFDGRITAAHHFGFSLADAERAAVEWVIGRLQQANTAPPVPPGGE